MICLDRIAISYLQITAYIYKMIDFCYDEAETAVEKERNRGDAEISAFLTNRSLRREKRRI